jgi:hypothetical protein
MYGGSYSAGPAPSAPPQRPNLLVAGTGAILITITACLVESAFEVLLFTDFSHSKLMNATSDVGSAAGALLPYLIITIVLNALIAVALGAGAALMMRRANVGRILNWAAGGVCLLVRLCCLSGLGMFGVVQAELNQAASDSDVSMGQLAPGWEIGGAAICSSVALVTVIVGMIMIALPGVSVWFRARPAQPQQPAPYGYPPPYQGY